MINTIEDSKTVLHLICSSAAECCSECGAKIGEQEAAFFTTDFGDWNEAGKGNLKGMIGCSALQAEKEGNGEGDAKTVCPHCNGNICLNKCID